MGKKEKSTFASWHHSRNRKISCTATFVLPLRYFCSRNSRRKTKAKAKSSQINALDHLQSFNPLLHKAVETRLTCLPRNCAVKKKSWVFRYEFKNRNSKIWVLLSASNVCIVKYFPTNKSHYCFRLDSNSNINNSLAKLSWTSCSPPLNSSHEHPSEQEEQLNDMKDRRTCFPDGKSL